MEQMMKYGVTGREPLPLLVRKLVGVIAALEERIVALEDKGSTPEVKKTAKKQAAAVTL